MGRQKKAQTKTWRDVKTWIGLGVGITIAQFFVFLISDNGMGIDEVVYRTAVVAVLLAVAIGIYAIISAKRRKTEE